MVARGKSVHAPVGELEFAGYDRNGNTVTRARFKVIRPGGEVTLPVSEIARLRRDGFLEDPDRKITAPTGGLHKSVPLAWKPPGGDQPPPAAA